MCKSFVLLNKEENGVGQMLSHCVFIESVSAVCVYLGPGLLIQQHLHYTCVWDCSLDTCSEGRRRTVRSEKKHELDYKNLPWFYSKYYSENDDLIILKCAFINASRGIRRMNALLWGDEVMIRVLKDNEKREKQRKRVEWQVYCSVYCSVAGDIDGDVNIEANAAKHTHVF